MSHNADSRGMAGAGLLPLQDHGYREKGQELDDRSCLAAYRIAGRDDLGKWLYDDDSAGDLIGGSLWPVNGSSTEGRPIPAWSFAMPVMVPLAGAAGMSASGGSTVPTPITGGAGSGGDAGGGAGGGGGGGGGSPPGPGSNIGATKRVGDYIHYYGLNGEFVGSAPIHQGGIQLGVVGGGGLGVFGVNVQPFGVLGLAQGNGMFGIGVTPWNQLNGFTDWMLIAADSWVARAAKAKAEVQRGKDGAKGAQGAAAQKFGEDGPEGPSDETVSLAMLPIGGLWSVDRRFAAKSPLKPFVWPDLPGGTYGISVPGTDEHRQMDQFHPTDPRLVAPHVAAQPSYASLIADLTPSGDFDVDRHAGIHSLLRVVKRPVGGSLLLKANKKRSGNDRRNWLARSIGPSGQWDVCGGLVMDTPQGHGSMARGARILAHESRAYGGPFDVGHYGDKHAIGSDADGNPINSLHISCDALFKMIGDPLRDGPVLFEAMEWPDPKEHPYPVLVHLSWDQRCDIGEGKAKEGAWRFWTTSYWDPTRPTITPERTPTPDPKDPQPPPETGTPTPTGGEGGVPEGAPDGAPDPAPDDPYRRLTPEEQEELERLGGFSSISAAAAAERREHYAVASPIEVCVPSIVGRPTLMHDGGPDLRYNHRPSLAVVEEFKRITPLTWRLEAFGAQAGPEAGGPYLSVGSEWSYTQQPGRSRHPGGTAAGGFVIMPPEVDLSQIDEDLALGEQSLSQVFGVMSPEGRWAAGLPELVTGGVRDGFSWGVERATGDFVWYAHDSQGATTEVWRWTAGSGPPVPPAPAVTIDNGYIFDTLAMIPVGPLMPGFLSMPIATQVGPATNVDNTTTPCTLIVQTPGDYNVEVNVTMEDTAIGPWTCGVAVMVNGMPTSVVGRTALGMAGPGEVRNICSTGTVTLALGDQLTIGMDTTVPGATANVLECGLKAIRLT